MLFARIFVLGCCLSFPAFHVWGAMQALTTTMGDALSQQP